MADNITFHSEKIDKFIAHKTLENNLASAEKSYQQLIEGTGRGSDFTGWVDLPDQVTNPQLDSIISVAQELSNQSEFIVAIGIGGSYLGAKAVISALKNYFSEDKILFAGHNLNADYHEKLINFCKDKNISIIAISKSGTTTEPAIAFRLLRELLEDKYGKEKASKRIVAITDKENGSLRELSIRNGYKTFTIPDNVGGRFSVLTPVGLLPIATAGLDIRELVKGAQSIKKTLMTSKGVNNPAFLYAAIRNILYQQKKGIEVFVNFDDRLSYFSEWLKQLFGESEGKEQKGIFPASVSFTTDLHSLGQYIQEGERKIFETILSIEQTNNSLLIPYDKDNLDHLNYLADKDMSYVNNSAMKGTIQAHLDGGVPIIKLSIPVLNEFYLGQLIYFFELSCALSGYMLNINPFDQPGVEMYKRNMFTILKKPGFEY